MRRFEYDNCTHAVYADICEARGRVKIDVVGFLKTFAQLMGVSTPSSSKPGKRVEGEVTSPRKEEARQEGQRQDKRVP